MSDLIKTICMYIIAGIVVTSLCDWIDSSFLSKFLDDNLITLLLALLAINTTTISVIMTKLREITDKNKIDFARTIKAMKDSIIHQVGLLCIALIFLIAKNSTWLTSMWGNFSFIMDSLIFTVFACAIHILFDTANGIFVILQHENGSG
jgi:hypothetical protein